MLKAGERYKSNTAHIADVGRALELLTKVVWGCATQEEDCLSAVGIYYSGGRLGVTLTAEELAALGIPEAPPREEG